MSTTDDVFKTINAAFELIGAGQSILGQIYAAQQKRKADGKELTAADLRGLMDSGDIQAAREKAAIAQAVLDQQAS